MSNPLASLGNVIPLRRLSAPGAGVAAAAVQPTSADDTPAEDEDDEGPTTGGSGEGRGRGVQRRRAWLRECAVIAASYALNGFFLALFAIIGTVSWVAAPLYTLPGLAVSALAAYLIASHRTERLKDPSLSVVHSVGSVSVCVLGVGLFPQMAFAYGVMLFTVFITATYRMPKWQVQLMLVLVVLAFGGVTLSLGHTLRIPNASTAERFVSWLFFVGTLGRCVLLSVINAQNNRLLRDRGQQMKATLAQIERLANHDELTGVLNRRRLLQILDEERAHTDRSGAPVSVALFDLDHFKAINDTLGHLTGDQVLKQFAAAVQAQARTTDRFGRYGGEEFLLILTGADGAQAEQAVERTRNALSLVDWGAIAPGLRVTFSAGVATYRDQESPELLLGRADLGLYQAKHDGRNCTRAA
ncbi:MAG TPA: GGDEF domain-containing protein [Rhizobacter sp.]|nr:GGDEF domain-containing protein [Rhizobacter sp.]